MHELGVSISSLHYVIVGLLREEEGSELYHVDVFYIGELLLRFGALHLKEEKTIH